MIQKLLENWKSFVLNEAAKTIEDLISSNAKVEIRSGKARIRKSPGFDIRIFVDEPDMERDDRFEEGYEFGAISAHKANLKVDDGACLEAFVVEMSEAEQGWGPFMYDIALEFVGNNGLTPDRDSVTDDAFGVWNYYLNKRSDVSWKQLDNEEGELTPHDETDDCGQIASDNSARKRGTKSWDKDPLSKVYYKLDKKILTILEKNGRLIVK